MEARELEESLRTLDTLAAAEYHASLAEVATEPGYSDERRLLRIGRLLGVTLKEPFAISKNLAVRSPFSGAYRAWDLKPEAAFHDAQVQQTWQYRALETLRSDPDVIRSLGWQAQSAYDLAQTAQTERGFFWYLAMSSRRYLCRDQKLRGEIERQVRAAERAGLDLKNVTPELIVASGGLSIGAALVHSVPVLGMMGAPVIAGLVFIFYSVGIDAFCQWANEHEQYHADFPNADKQ